MGYDMSITSFKKKSLEEANRMLKKYKPSFEDAYHHYLHGLLYPYDSDNSIERAKWICSSGVDVFRDFFNPELENDTVVIIEKETYEKMLPWLEEKIKSISLYDVASENVEEWKAREMISVYKQMKSAEIDFETEFVVYEHDW